MLTAMLGVNFSFLPCERRRGVAHPATPRVLWQLNSYDCFALRFARELRATIGSLAQAAILFLSLQGVARAGTSALHEARLH
jgi:hypothetical protein